MNRVKEWNQISDDYKDASVILGNGASIAMNRCFDYGSLHSYAVKNNFINAELAKLFDKFETTNFELVLYKLWQAKEVLSVLEIDTTLLEKNYSLCRDVLITTIQKAHIQYEKANELFIEKLDKASDFLKKFKTVFSLNYDLILYWIIARGNREGIIFKDCFINKLDGTDFNLFECEWDFLRSAQSKFTPILVFYPHGNLTFARLKQEHLREVDLKICSPGQKHLEKILDVWKSGRVEPLFISEGDYKEKLNRIKESEYLRNVYKQGFKEIKEQMVIYGWSLSDQDDHILNRLIKNQKKRLESDDQNISPPIKRIAVSIYPNGSEENFIREIKKKLAPLNAHIDLYYANRNCWCY